MWYIGRPIKLVTTWSARVRLCVPLIYLLILGGWALPASPQTAPTDTRPSCSTFSNFCDLIIREARRTGLDPALIDAVMAIESNYQVNTMGAAGEIGLMQVLPSTAKLLGFRGDDFRIGGSRHQHPVGSDLPGGRLELGSWGPLPVIDEVSCRSWRGTDDRIIDRVLPTGAGTPCASEPSSRRSQCNSSAAGRSGRQSEYSRY